MKSVRIVGAGLLGTSLALALKNSNISVELVDVDANHLALAKALVGDEGLSTSPEVVVLAIPATALMGVIESEYALNPGATFIDIASTKTKSLLEIEKFPAIARQFCGTHPMAGRERGGPHGARADLFEDRAWIYCPTSETSPESLSRTLELIALSGAIAVAMSGPEHDQAVALISHLPQITSSLLAKQLHGAKSDWFSVAGQGLRDTTRIAASDPALWGEIIHANQNQILPLLKGLRDDIDSLIANLSNTEHVQSFIADGASGRAKIPGKHGGKARDYHYLPIVIEDKAGQLAALFNECAQAKVNIEDLVIEHSPGQFTGLITLALSPNDAKILSQHLLEAGWNVHSVREGL